MIQRPHRVENQSLGLPGKRRSGVRSSTEQRQEMPSRMVPVPALAMPLLADDLGEEFATLPQCRASMQRTTLTSSQKRSQCVPGAPRGHRESPSRSPRRTAQTSRCWSPLRARRRRACTKRHASLAQRACEGGACGEVAAHAVDAATRRCRGRAEVETASGSRVRREANDGAGAELAGILETGGEVSAQITSGGGV